VETAGPGGTLDLTQCPRRQAVGIVQVGHSGVRKDPRDLRVGVDQPPGS
jgi:hypothetical protein